MRTLTDHIVDGDQAVQLEIEVIDEPGAGGANHHYAISGFESEGNPSAPSHFDGLDYKELHVVFQNGPIKESGVNGITQEVLLAIVIDRLNGFQGGPYASPFNASALDHCRSALRVLQTRTRERLARGVEGTHTI